MNLSVDNNVNSTLIDHEKMVLKNSYAIGSFVCACLMIPVAIFGIIGNGFTIYIFTTRSKSSSINFLVSGLAAIDIVLVIVGTIVFASMAFHSYYNSVNLLLVIRYLIVTLYPVALIAQTASVWTMIVITLERYLAVCWPLRAIYLCDRRHANIALVCIIIFSVCYNIVRFWEYEFYPNENRLELLLKGNQMYVRVYNHWLYFVTIFLIPFLVLLIFQSLIISAIQKARQNRLQLSRQQWSEHRTALMMVVIMCSFLVCNLLALILNAMETLNDDAFKNYSDVFVLLSDVNNLLVEINSSLNFIVYYYFSQNFRFAFSRMFVSLKRSKTKRSTVSASRSSAKGLSFKMYRLNSVPEQNCLLGTTVKQPKRSNVL